jgi:hypothetical protein
MFIKQQEVVTSEEKLAASKETAEAKALVAQYHVTVLDPKKLLSPDREKATWRKKRWRAACPDVQAVTDWGNLRRFAKVSGLRYTILQVSPSSSSRLLIHVTYTASTPASTYGARWGSVVQNSKR